VFGPPELAEDAFGAGASEYLCVPWTLAELEARIRRISVCRIAVPSGTIIVGGGVLDGPGGRVPLGKGEQASLYMLWQKRPSSIPREALEKSFGVSPHPSRSLDEAIMRLRKKLDEAAGISGLFRTRLVSLRNNGYVLK